MKPSKKYKYLLPIIFLVSVLIFFVSMSIPSTQSFNIEEIAQKTVEKLAPVPTFNLVAYNEKVLSLVNDKSLSTSTVSIWPPKTTPPLVGAILPFKRVIAYYGNLYSKQMGVLGEYPETQMLQMLDDEVKRWEAADPTTPVQPALHYIASTAQSEPGRDGLYTLRMPDSEIDKIIEMAEKSNSIVFLDLQIGLSTLEKEIPFLDKYLKMPQVHLGLDPEFSMKGGQRPGSVIGTMSAEDINFATNYLAKIVQENNLPPKILVIHRFTEKMLTGYRQIKTIPEVQIVIDMDGWGSKARKINTYTQIIYPEPIQFTGFKLFYKNDLKEGGGLMTPLDLLELSPRPIYIQYQ